jgi:VanZ family protein
LSGSDLPGRSRTPPELATRRRPVSFFVLERLRDWGPALIWAAIMFWASTDAYSSQHTGRILAPVLRWIYSGITQEQLDLVNAVLRKVAHLAEYFVLYLLVYRGLSGGRARWRVAWALGALIIAMGYSVLDEIHQSFVASRTASPWDAMLDTTGALAALLLTLILSRLSGLRSSNSRRHVDALRHDDVAAAKRMPAPRERP